MGKGGGGGPSSPFSGAFPVTALHASSPRQSPLKHTPRAQCVPSPRYPEGSGPAGTCVARSPFWPRRSGQPPPGPAPPSARPMPASPCRRPRGRLLCAGRGAADAEAGPLVPPEATPTGPAPPAAHNALRPAPRASSGGARRGESSTARGRLGARLAAPAHVVFRASGAAAATGVVRVARAGRRV